MCLAGRDPRMCHEGQMCLALGPPRTSYISHAGRMRLAGGRLQGYVMQERCVECWGLQEQVKSCRKDMFSGWAFEDAGRMCLESKKRHFLCSIQLIGNYRRFPIELR